MAFEVFNFPQKVFLLLVLEDMGVEIVVLDCLGVVKVHAYKEGLVLRGIQVSISESLNVWILRPLKSYHRLWQFLLSTGEGLLRWPRL